MGINIKCRAANDPSVFTIMEKGEGPTFNILSRHYAKLAFNPMVSRRDICPL